MKLPDINYGNRATPMRGRGPEEAIQKARGIQEVASAITDTVNTIHKINEDYAITQATSAANNELSQLRRKYESREFFTADEVRNFKLDHLVQMVDGTDPSSGEDIERGVIPAHEVYPLLVDRQMDFSIQSGAGKIRNPQARNRWMNEMTARRTAVVDKVTLAAQEQAVAFTLKERQLDIAETQDSGNFDDAAELINAAYAGNEPARRAALEENEVLRERSRIDLALMSSDPSDIEDLMDEITSPEYLESTNLNTTELRQYYQAASARQDAATRAAQQAKTERSGALSSDLLAQLKTGQATQATIIANKGNLTPTDFRYLMGQADPASNSFSTPPAVRAQFEVQVLRLETGDYDGDYFERVEELQEWIIDTAYGEDPLTGATTIGISGADVNTWRGRLKDLEQEPFQTDAFKSVSKELQLRVLRGSEEMISLGAVDAESANLYAEATEDLRNYVRENGGIKADVTKWKKERMPYYLSESSKLSFYKLPRRVRSDAVMSGDFVDYRATLDGLKATLATETDPTERQLIRESITDFESWATTSGAYYVTR